MREVKVIVLSKYHFMFNKRNMKKYQFEGSFFVPYQNDSFVFSNFHEKISKFDLIT